MGILRLKPGVELYYRLIPGQPHRPYLVFLHEGLGSTAMWKSFPEMLCRRTGCPGLLYDRLGYGRSTGLIRPRRINYLHEYALIELPEVIAALIPGCRFFLIGHSDGGSISLIYASQQPAQQPAQQPDGLVGIISEAAHVFVDTQTLRGIQDTVLEFDKGKLNGLHKYHGEMTVEVFKAWYQTWLSDWFRHWNIQYLLPSIICPTLVLQGLDDPYGTIDQVETIVTQVTGPCRKALIPNCGHAPHREQNERVGDLMSEFIMQLI